MKSNKQKLVIIGNAEVTRDCGAFVDSCDVSIRFNDAANYNRNTGTRTTVMCVNNTGRSAKKFWKQKKLMCTPFAHDAGEIWFPKKRGKFLTNVLYRILKRKRFIEHGEKIVSRNALHGKKVIYFDDALADKVWSELRAFGPAEGIHLSSGILAIEYVLTEARFSQYEKYLVGFTWEGWEGHPFSEEREYAMSKVRNSDLNLI